MRPRSRRMVSRTWMPNDSPKSMDDDDIPDTCVCIIDDDDIDSNNNHPDESNIPKAQLSGNLDTTNFVSREISLDNGKI